MKGVVLCGGQSSRMGSDKGLLCEGQLTWAELATNKFLQINIENVLSINPSQFPDYSKKFDADVLVEDDDSLLSIKGPLKGIMSVHLRFPSEDLLVLACDMIHMQAKVLEILLQEFAINGATALAFADNNGVEPLCAVYSAAGLRKIAGLHEAGQLKYFSMKYLLDLLDAVYLPIKEKDSFYFSNCNTPADRLIDVSQEH